MKRYERFIEWVRMLSLFSAVFCADFALKQLEHRNIQPLIAAITLGLIAIFTLHVTELLTVHCFEAFPRFKRWFLGEQWIEGMWFDEVVGQDHYALVTIGIIQGVVKVTGEQYDKSGNVTATWESLVALLEGSTLRTIYRAPQFRNVASRAHNTEETGFSTYVFTGLPGVAPNFYSGSFVDGSHDGRRCQLRGMRLTDPLQIANVASPSARKMQLSELIEQLRRTRTQ